MHKPRTRNDKIALPVMKGNDLNYLADVAAISGFDDDREVTWATFHDDISVLAASASRQGPQAGYKSPWPDPR